VIWKLRVLRIFKTFLGHIYTRFLLIFQIFLILFLLRLGPCFAFISIGNLHLIYFLHGFIIPNFSILIKYVIIGPVIELGLAQRCWIEKTPGIIIHGHEPFRLISIGHFEVGILGQFFIYLALRHVYVVGLGNCLAQLANGLDTFVVFCSLGRVENY
jgi:hypothetical protein